MKTLFVVVLVALLSWASGENFQNQSPAQQFSPSSPQPGAAPGPNSPMGFSPQQPQQPQQAADKDFGYSSTTAAQNAAGQQGYYYYYYPVKDANGYPGSANSWSTSTFGNGFDLGSSWSRWGMTDIALAVAVIGVIVVVGVVIGLYPNLVQVNARALKEVATPERIARLTTLVTDAIEKYSKKN